MTELLGPDAAADPSMRSFVVQTNGAASTAEFLRRASDPSFLQELQELVEMISPFATPENKLSEAMLIDLIQGPFKTTAFHLHRTDPQSGRRDKVTVAQHVQ